MKTRTVFLSKCGQAGDVFKGKWGRILWFESNTSSQAHVCGHLVHSNSAVWGGCGAYKDAALWEEACYGQALRVWASPYFLLALTVFGWTSSLSFLPLSPLPCFPLDLRAQINSVFHKPLHITLSYHSNRKVIHTSVKPPFFLFLSFFLPLSTIQTHSWW